MKMHHFDSKFTVGAKLPNFDEKIVKDEPMFFSATPSFAYANGGPITTAFLERCFPLIEGFLSAYDGAYCFDSRVHMLMPGWWPCIPGWHHDDVPRSRSDGQPNYDTPEYHSKHILALVNGDICPTEFAVGSAAYKDIPVGMGNIYKHWHDAVEEDIRDGVMERVQVPSNRLIHFDCNSFHQGTQAVGRGFRWFGRLTWDAGYENGRPQHNEIRRQVNVYMDNVTEGW
jgi:hypothetical protein